MSEDFANQVADEVRRIQNLDLAEQPEAFAQLREMLEKALETVDTNGN
ncbi:MAG: hypothetical protein ACKOWE_03545 [Micrococcales bacterium]